MADIMEKSEAKNILRNLAKYGKIAYSEHSIDQMISRNVTTEDILYVLMWGEIKNIKQDTVRHNWKCKVVGKTIDEEKLTVIAAIYSEIETIVITVF
jgi:citrate synthase